MSGPHAWNCTARRVWSVGRRCGAHIRQFRILKRVPRSHSTELRQGKELDRPFELFNSRFWNENFFAPDNFGRDSKPRNNYVILSTNARGDSKEWAGKVLFLFNLEASTCGVYNELWFMQYLECMPFLTRLTSYWDVYVCDRQSVLKWITVCRPISRLPSRYQWMWGNALDWKIWEAYTEWCM